MTRRTAHRHLLETALLVVTLVALASGCGPRQAEGCPPAWQPGTREEVEKAVGFRVWTPQQVPEGYRLAQVAHLAGATTISCEREKEEAAQACFAITQMRAADHPAEAATWSAQVDGATTLTINGRTAVLQRTLPEPGDKVSRGWTSIRWEQDGWLFLVDGDIPPEEIIRVADSLATPEDRP